MNMNTTLSNVIIFAAGATIGSVVTWRLLETKYEKLVQEEIASIREPFAHKELIYDVAKDSDEDRRIRDPKVVEEYEEKTKEYRNYSNIVKKEVDKLREPYVIKPEEYGESGYDTLEFTYYADDILADELDDPVENIDEVVGADFADHFGDYEDDSVHIRNDELKCDYEILKDYRSYYDVVGER